MPERVSNDQLQEYLDTGHITWEGVDKIVPDLLDARQHGEDAEKHRHDQERRAERAEREMIAWRAAIQRITPGGSEFMDPESVERWAQKQNRELGQAKMDVVKLRRELDEAIEAIKLLVERAARIIGTPQFFTNENTNTGIVEAALGYLERLMSDAARAVTEEQKR